jgi:HEAT repeat protein
MLRSARRQFSLLILLSLLLTSLVSMAQAQTTVSPPQLPKQPLTPRPRPPLPDDLSPEIEGWISQLHHSNPASTKIKAVYNLGEKRQAAQVAVPYMIGLLEDKDPNVRIAAIQAFQKMQESAREAIPHLIPLLKDTNPEVRIWLTYALGEMGGLAAAAVPELKVMREDANIDIAVGASQALTRIDRETRSTTLASLIQQMQDSDPQVRSQAAFSLKLMGRFAQEVMPQLVELLQDSRSDVQQEAASVLAAIAVDAKIAIPAPAVPFLQR